MNWRVFTILAVGLVGVMMNGWMLSQETLEATGQQEDLVNEANKDPLQNIQYISGNRDKHLADFGLPKKLRDAAFKKMTSFAKRKVKIVEWLQEEQGTLAPIFCAGGLSQRYAALSVLVVNESGQRRAYKPNELFTLEEQPWYDTVVVEQVYEHVEVTAKRNDDATVMGVAAILLSRERDILAGNSPWGSSFFGGWSLEEVLASDETIEMDLINYFAMMYVITEIANKTNESGICRD
jgi:hypothetical protein